MIGGILLLICSLILLGMVVTDKQTLETLKDIMSAEEDMDFESEFWLEETGDEQDPEDCYSEVRHDRP